MFENLLLERDGPVAVLTINRPQVLNALDSASLDELHRATRELADDSAVRAVVITGAGEKAFAAGADIRELAAMGPDASRAHARRGQAALAAIEEMNKPVVAAINGFALGGGCELAMACTFRIAAERARLGQPEISLGMIPGFAGTQRLTRLVGRAVALDLLLTGRHVEAEEALRLGLVHRVVPGSRLMAAARALAAEMAAKAPLAVRYILEAVRRGADMTMDDAQALEASLFGLAAASDDSREGTAAFLEKRAPAFKGT